MTREATGPYLHKVPNSVAAHTLTSSAQTSRGGNTLATEGFPDAALGPPPSPCSARPPESKRAACTCTVATGQGPKNMTKAI